MISPPPSKIKMVTERHCQVVERQFQVVERQTLVAERCSGRI